MAHEFLHRLREKLASRQMRSVIDGLPLRHCSHQALPFVEAAAKAKFASSVETQPGRHLAALSAFRVIDVSIMTTRNKDVRCKRIVLALIAASSDSTSRIAAVSRSKAH
jgi:hypothetical protein